MLIFYKEIDQSVLSAGFTIPVVLKQQIFDGLGFKLNRGQKRSISIDIDGCFYDAIMTNVLFDSVKYPTHGDLLQIRYGNNSPLATALREKFLYTQSLIRERERQTGAKRLKNLAENDKEFISIYSTDMPGVLSFECLTNQEFREESNELCQYPEQVAENVLLVTDEHAAIHLSTRVCKIRHLTRAVGDNLKLVYGFQCQICGQYIGEKYGSNLIHAHHIRYFTESFNNNASNILIVCPNHHGIIHDTNAQFDYSRKVYRYPSGYEEGLKLNQHI